MSAAPDDFPPQISPPPLTDQELIQQAQQRTAALLAMLQSDLAELQRASEAEGAAPHLAAIDAARRLAENLDHADG